EDVPGAFAAAVVLQGFGLGFSVAKRVVDRGTALPDRVAVFLDLVGVAVRMGDRTLQLPQHVGHAHAREYRVVPAGFLGGVAVEGAQEGVDVVYAGGPQVGRLGARDDGKVGRRSAEPLGAVLAGHGDLHEVADLVGREKQVLLDV